MANNKYLAIIYRIFAIAGAIIIFFEVLFKLGYFPLLTNSISFDAKIAYLNEKKIQRVEIAAVGSSLSLNDLSSQVVKDSLKVSYFNFASWGLQMSDIREMITGMILSYHPKYVIIASSFEEFENAGNVVSIKNYVETPYFIKQHFEEYFYIKNFNSVFDIIHRKKELDILTAEKSYYNSLFFDELGGVMMNIPKPKISVKRWNEHKEFPTVYTNNQYKELLLLSKTLKENHIRLMFVCTPLKKSYINTSAIRHAIDYHFAICKSIVEKYDGVYLNFDGTDTNNFAADSLFVDQYHLSNAGAILFTKKITHALKSLYPDLRTYGKAPVNRAQKP